MTAEMRPVSIRAFMEEWTRQVTNSARHTAMKKRAYKKARQQRLRKSRAYGR